MDRKQVAEAMETDKIKSLTAFNAAIDELLNATYIIVSGKISRLLQSIAQSRPLYEYFCDITHGYNFVDDLNTRKFRDENGKPYLDVPKESKELTRFAFCLLFAVDTGRMNIRDLLHTFYNSPDADTELKAFCAEVIVPFKTYVNREIVGGRTAEDRRMPDAALFEREEGESAKDFFERASRRYDEETQNADADTDEEAEEAEETDEEPAAAEPAPQDDTPAYKRPLSDLTLASLSQLIAEIMGLVSRDGELETLEREELMLVLDAFNQAVQFKERKSIRVMYIAVKNTILTCDCAQKLEMQTENLSNFIRELGIEA